MPVSVSNLRIGADVYSSDSHKLGSLHRIVLKRSDLSLTHVVVDIGFLRSGHHLWEGGLGLDYDRVVLIGQVGSISENRVELTMSAAAFKDAPEYTQEHFEEPHDLSPNQFDISDLTVRAQQLAGFITSTSSAWLVERLNKPLDAIDIKDGTDVWRQEPHEKLGDIKRLLVDPASGRLQAFVIRRGVIFKQDVILPVRYVSELFDDLVRVDISDAELAQLREHVE